jgi:hypothetical protein
MSSVVPSTDKQTMNLLKLLLIFNFKLSGLVGNVAPFKNLWLQGMSTIIISLIMALELSLSVETTTSVSVEFPIASFYLLRIYPSD